MCTTICFRKENQIIIGNNEDTHIKNGMLFTNHRNLKKRALLTPPEKPYEWESRFGSITFSQCGKEFPCSGINEFGLVVELMTLPETVYPLADDRYAIRELQWIQMLLDTCKTSEEAANVTKKVRLSQSNWPIHLLVCDATGDFRVFEYLNGDLLIFGQSSDRIPVLTNSPYLDSIDYFNRRKSCAEIQDTPQYDSIERFVKACALTSKVNEFLSSPIKTCFEILSLVATIDTIWSFAYNASKTTLFLKDFLNKSKATIALKDFDFSSNASWKLMDLSSKRDILSEVNFENYTFNMNQKLVKSFFHNNQIANQMGYHVPEEALMNFALYPEKLS